MTAVIDKNAAGVATKSSRYTYDAMNRRITESVDETPNDTVDAAIGHFVYDREDIVTELIDADGKGPQKPTVRTQYMHGPGIDQVLARESSGATEWLLTDHLGSTVLIVNSVGAQVASAIYDSFGNTIATTGTMGRFGYTGRELDASTGLYYYRARYYDPGMGRFISEDPIGFEGGDANLARYVGNLTTMGTDPYGTRYMSYQDVLLSQGPEAAERQFQHAQADAKFWIGLNDGLNRVDQAAAGYASGLTFGLTDAARSAIYGCIATQNQQGMIYEVFKFVGETQQNFMSPGSAATKVGVSQLAGAVKTEKAIVKAASLGGFGAKATNKAAAFEHSVEATTEVFKHFPKNFKPSWPNPFCIRSVECQVQTQSV